MDPQIPGAMELVATAAEAPPAGPTSVTERAFSVLLSFDDRHREQTMSSIARRTGLPVATVHRLLRKLEAMRAVERDAEGTYSIGPAMWRLGILAKSHDVIGRGARPLLMSFAARTGADVRVLSYFNEAAMCVDEILASSMSAHSGLGTLHSLDATAGGLAVAMQLLPDDLLRLRLTRSELLAVERHIDQASRDRFVVVERPEATEVAVVLHVPGRPPMSVAAVRRPSPGWMGARGLASLLHETARALASVLNDRAGA